MKSYSPVELAQIFAQIAPNSGVLIPAPSPIPASPKGGPALCVYLRYSDIAAGTQDLEQRYWDLLQQTPVVNGIGVLATINGILSEYRMGHAEVHRTLNERFLSPDLRVKVSEYQPGGPAFAGVFNKVGCLQLMRHLIVYGDRSMTSDDKDVAALGELLLLTNQFIQPEFQPVQASNLGLLLQFLPIWDVCNPRDLAYTLSRMYTILREILPGKDAQVPKLASKIGIDPATITIDGLSLDDFLSAIFGLYSYGRKMDSPTQAQFDMREVFSKVGFPSGVLETLVNARARTLSEFAQRLSNDKPATREVFVDELRRRAFLSESLNVFRTFPLFRVDSNRVLILDLQFLVELLTSGVYWSLFDSLPTGSRDTFRELWGRLFELYTVGLLHDFYPSTSGILTADLEHETGQVDALLDFGPDVLVFEVKASLLTELAKRRVDEAEFLKDFNRKFVRNEKSAPKAVLQLVASCKALADGTIRTATEPGRIYPIFVSDEPAVETFFFNTFMNEIFQQELSNSPKVQPLTAMSINNLEELLPYVSENAFSWTELLRSRFIGKEVGTFSVHQAIYDLARSKGLPPIRNQAIRKTFDQVWSIIKSRYKPPVAK
jgi:hypothetical protein